MSQTTQTKACIPAIPSVVIGHVAITRRHIATMITTLQQAAEELDEFTDPIEEDAEPRLPHSKVDAALAETKKTLAKTTLASRRLVLAAQRTGCLPPTATQLVAQALRMTNDDVADLDPNFDKAVAAVGLDFKMMDLSRVPHRDIAALLLKYAAGRGIAQRNPSRVAALAEAEEAITKAWTKYAAKNAALPEDPAYDCKLWLRSDYLHPSVAEAIKKLTA